MKKKVATWHKNKTAPKSATPQKNTKTKPTKKHWLESRAKLTKIMEISGMTPESHKLLPYNRNR